MTLLEKTLQTVAEARTSVAVNEDDIQAGFNDVAHSRHGAGGFLSFPAGASLGTLKWFASNNAGNYNITHTNASFGQSTAFVVPDPANANAVHLVGAGAHPFVSGNVPMASGTDGLMVDSGVALASLQPFTATVTIVASDVTGAYAAPKVIIAAPGAGKTIVILNCQIYTSVSTAFAGGGVAVLQYDSTVHGAGTVALSATTPAVEITAAASQIYSQLGLGSIATTVLTGVTNKGIYFSNQTGAFTGGAGSTITFTIQYLTLTATV